jgi:hypothetical protein
VNLNGVAVSFICYDTFVSNECSSPLVRVSRISDLIWLAVRCRREGNIGNTELLILRERSNIAVEKRLFLVPLCWPVFGDVVSKRNVLS